MRDRVLGLAFVCFLGSAAPAAADALPSCPPGHRMDCHPSEFHHGCGGCVPIEEPARPEPRVEPEPPPEAPPPVEPDEPAAEPEVEAEVEPAQTATPAAETQEEPSGGCAAAPARRGGGALALLLALVVFRRAHRGWTK